MVTAWGPGTNSLWIPRDNCIFTIYTTAKKAKYREGYIVCYLHGRKVEKMKHIHIFAQISKVIQEVDKSGYLLQARGLGKDWGKLSQGGRKTS